MFKKKKEKSKSKNDFEEYLDRGTFWDEEVVHKAMRSERLAWKVSFVSLVLAGLSVFAVTVLAPLKTVIPYVIEVDKLTGEVQVKQPIDESPVPQYESVSKYFLSEYVRARLGYDRNDFNYRYDKVVAMSDYSVAQPYAIEMDKKNPESPIVKYGERGVVQILIRRITFIEKNTVLIRLTKVINLPNLEKQFKEYEATVSFEYSKSALDEETRLITPLGFKVTKYRIDPILNN
jgi:type IV secretion system protein VirB8